MTLTQTIISTILQILVFTFVPFLAYLIMRRRITGFFGYLGLISPTGRSIVFALLFFLAVIPVAMVFAFVPELRGSMSAGNTVTGQLRLLGFSFNTLSILLILAVFKTSFSEELLFRGFIGKRLIDSLGFHTGNALQAVIFGAVHLLIFIAQPFSWLLATTIVLFPAIGGWATGYLNERIGNGSIIPGWLLHGGINILAYSVLAFW